MPIAMILPSIETPADLKELSDEQLVELCEEIRAFIVDTVTTTGEEYRLIDWTVVR